jgi:hypothetical protein
VQGVQDLAEVGRRGVEARAHARDGGCEPCCTERLHHIVDGALLERRDRVLVVRGHEHDVAATAGGLRHLEARQPRHLDVEEHHLRLAALHRVERLDAVLGLGDDAQAGQSRVRLSLSSPRRTSSSSAMTASVMGSLPAVAAGLAVVRTGSDPIARDAGWLGSSCRPLAAVNRSSPTGPRRAAAGLAGRRSIHLNRLAASDTQTVASTVPARSRTSLRVLPV